MWPPIHTHGHAAVLTSLWGRQDDNGRGGMKDVKWAEKLIRPSPCLTYRVSNSHSKDACIFFIIVYFDFLTFCAFFCGGSEFVFWKLDSIRMGILFFKIWRKLSRQLHTDEGFAMFFATCFKALLKVLILIEWNNVIFGKIWKLARNYF